MRLWTVFVLALVASSTAFVVGVARGQRARSGNPRAAAMGPAEKRPLTPLIPEVQLADEPPPAPWVEVDWGLTLDLDSQVLYQQMADLISGVTAVPTDRVNYYSAVIDSVSSWAGGVMDVQAVGNSYVVTVQVDPLFAEGSRVGSSASVLSDYSEIYCVDADNTVTYLGFSDPNGWAGQAPCVVVY